jgi:hypothetical protein
MCQRKDGESSGRDDPLYCSSGRRSRDAERLLNGWGSLPRSGAARAAQGHRPPAEAAAKPPPEAWRLDSVEKDYHNWDRISIGFRLICGSSNLLSSTAPVPWCLSPSLPVSLGSSVLFRVVRCRAPSDRVDQAVRFRCSISGVVRGVVIQSSTRMQPRASPL